MLEREFEPYLDASLEEYATFVARNHAISLDAARALNDQAPVQPPAPVTSEAFLARFPNAHTRFECPQCGARLIRSARLAPVRAPP